MYFKEHPVYKLIPLDLQIEIGTNPETNEESLLFLLFGLSDINFMNSLDEECESAYMEFFNAFINRVSNWMESEFDHDNNLHTICKYLKKNLMKELDNPTSKLTYMVNNHIVNFYDKLDRIIKNKNNLMYLNKDSTWNEYVANAKSVQNSDTSATLIDFKTGSIIE